MTTVPLLWIRAAVMTAVLLSQQPCRFHETRTGLCNSSNTRWHAMCRHVEGKALVVVLLGVPFHRMFFCSEGYLLLVNGSRKMHQLHGRKTLGHRYVFVNVLLSPLVTYFRGAHRLFAYSLLLFCTLVFSIRQIAKYLMYLAYLSLNVVDLTRETRLKIQSNAVGGHGQSAHSSGYTKQTRWRSQVLSDRNCILDSSTSLLFQSIWHEPSLRGTLTTC